MASDQAIYRRIGVGVLAATAIASLGIMITNESNRPSSANINTGVNLSPMTHQVSALGPPVTVHPTQPPSLHVVSVIVGATHGSVTLGVGQQLRVVLDSLYWLPQPSSNPKVLDAVGPAVSTARNGCVAGQGCGTVVVTYAALKPGSVSVRATRSTCGEAMGCTPRQSSLEISVHVT